jgi:hypothetical protein
MSASALILLLSCVAMSVETGAADRKLEARTAVITTCADLFGPPANREPLLFDVNQYYVLQVTFDRCGNVAELGVVPKHWFADERPEWDSGEAYPELTEPEYRSLAARLEAVRPKGALRDSATISVVTNLTARIRDRYEHCILETGEVVDIRRPDDAPRLIRYFRIEYTIEKGCEIAEE